MTAQRTRSTAGAPAQQQVEFALNAHAMRPYLQRAGAACVEATKPAACYVLDAKCEPGAGGTVLYQAGERLLIGELQGPAAPSAQTPAEARHVRLYDYEDDPALPHLRTALDGRQMAAGLSRALPECASGAVHILRCRVTPLRYRLGKRLTLRYDLRLRDRDSGAVTVRTLYGKLYHNADKAAAVCAEMQMLAAAPGPAAAGVKLAAVAAFMPELPMLFQEPVGGVPLDLLLSQPPCSPVLRYGPRAHAGIRSAAAALAALHGSAVQTGRVRPVAGELARMQQRSERIMQAAPATGAGLRALACALASGLERLPEWGAEVTLVHGDCKPSQFFVTLPAQGSSAEDALMGAAVLDFDHCGMADPAADAGNFLASLRQGAVAQALRSPAPPSGPAGEPQSALLEAEFLAAYLAASPSARRSAEGFRLRATWYAAVALLRKSLRSYARSPRSPLPVLLAQEAWRCLAALPPAD